MRAAASWLAWSMAITTSSRWGPPIEISPGTRKTLVASRRAGEYRALTHRAGGWYSRRGFPRRSAVVRCDNCGFQNPEGALVCRRCRRRLRGRAEAAGPRRESEGELTLVVAEGLTRLAAIIGIVLVLGSLLAVPLYHRVVPPPGMFIITAVAFRAAGGGRWEGSSLGHAAR